MDSLSLEHCSVLKDVLRHHGRCPVKVRGGRVMGMRRGEVFKEVCWEGEELHTRKYDY